MSEQVSRLKVTDELTFPDGSSVLDDDTPTTAAAVSDVQDEVDQNSTDIQNNTDAINALDDVKVVTFPVSAIPSNDFAAQWLPGDFDVFEAGVIDTSDGTFTTSTAAVIEESDGTVVETINDKSATIDPVVSTSTEFTVFKIENNTGGELNLAGYFRIQ